MRSPLHRQVSADGHQQWRLTSRELAAIVAIAVLVASLAPRAVEAATTLMTISDYSNGLTARVDVGNKLRVGDGSGALTVDGTVYARPLSAALPWSASEDVTPTAALVPLAPGPVGGALNVTSISSSALGTTTSGDLALYVGHVPSSATSCGGVFFDGTIWHIPTASATVPLVVTFPTPLTWRPPVGTRACLVLRNYGGPVTFNVSGFFGG